MWNMIEWVGRCLKWAKASLQKIFYYSGGEFIWRKFYPNDRNIHPTGFVWLIALYVATFGLASQIYENRIDIVENRTNILISSLLNSNIGKNATRQIEGIQNTYVPLRPKFWNPMSVIFSIVGIKSLYPDSIERLQETLSLKKNDLTAAYLRLANLENTELAGANLERSILSHANLKKADMEMANLKGANLMGADFYLAKLDGADFRESIVYCDKKDTYTFASFTCDNYWPPLMEDKKTTSFLNAKNLTCKQLSKTKTDSTTIFPDYIKVTWADDDSYTCEMVEEDDKG